MVRKHSSTDHENGGAAHYISIAMLGLGCPVHYCPFNRIVHLLANDGLMDAAPLAHRVHTPQSCLHTHTRWRTDNPVRLGQKMIDFG